MADGDDTDSEYFDLDDTGEAGRDDRATPGTGNTAEGDARDNRTVAGSGYVVLETSALRQLEELCSVLDISYNQKLKEIGLRPGNLVKIRNRSKFLEDMRNLEAEKEARFSELRSKSRTLLRLWKTTHAPLKQGLLDIVFALVDAESSSDISEAKLLRSSLEDELKDEIDKLKHAEITETKKKYNKRKIELKNLMKSTHLAAADIKFDPDKKVEEKDLSQVTLAMKLKIDQVKSEVLDRKELIYRIQTLQGAIRNAWPYKTLRVLLERAKSEAQKVQATSSGLKFDGRDISQLLSSLELAASSVLDASAKAHMQDSSSAFVRSTTRSGTRYNRSVRDTGDTDVERERNTNLDWNKDDNKRMLNAVYRVRDLEATVESYKTEFGMDLLRRGVDTERRLTFAIVGFGPEESSFTLKLALYDGMDQFNIGDGFGNIGIFCKVHEVCGRIKTSEKSKITCQPASLKKKNSILIAVAKEFNGFTFELIEHATVLQLCQVMLRVRDLDKSVSFYEKGLGMKLALKKDLPLLKCAIAQLRYEGDSNSAFLELRFNYDVEEYSKGDAFLQITIGSDDVERSFELVEKAVQELGGKVLERPAQAAEATEQPRVASFEDPDGYKVVIMNNVDFLKEAVVHVVDDSEDDTCT